MMLPLKASMILLHIKEPEIGATTPLVLDNAPSKVFIRDKNHMQCRIMPIIVCFTRTGLVVAGSVCWLWHYILDN